MEQDLKGSVLSKLEVLCLTWSNHVRAGERIKEFLKEGFH